MVVSCGGIGRQSVLTETHSTIPPGHDSTTTSVKKIFSEIEPNLYQNVPNPFNSITYICYDVPRPSHVSLQIYNVLGKKVATLVDTLQVPGTYEVAWETNSMVSAIFFYQITMAQDDSTYFNQTLKMTLLR